MTKIDPKTLHNGDVVLMRGTVSGNKIVFAGAVDIVSVEPRPIAVGDKVLYGRHDEPCAVVAIHGDHVWVKAPIGGGWITFLSTLRREG